jgi:hypothetical protein
LLISNKAADFKMHVPSIISLRTAVALLGARATQPIQRTRAALEVVHRLPGTLHIGSLIVRRWEGEGDTSSTKHISNINQRPIGRLHGMQATNTMENRNDRIDG